MHAWSSARGWCCVGALLSALGVPGSGTAAQELSPATNPVVFLTIEHRVEVRLHGTDRWLDATTNMLLEPGDQGRTLTNSRATLRLSDLSTLRIGERSVFQIEPPPAQRPTPLFRFFQGLMYFFHRDQPADMKVLTPTSTAAIRGTEFALEQDEQGRTTVTVLDGRVELTGQQGPPLTLTNQQQAVAEVGQPPRRTPLLNTRNVIQWCLYYPAVLDPDELELSASEQQSLSASLSAYRQGDLLRALAEYPAGRPPQSASDKVYYAALLLTVGQVKEAEDLVAPVLSAIPSDRQAALAAALRKLVAAVKGQVDATTLDSRLTTCLLAESYYRQSRALLEKGALEAARAAARQATTKSPRLGFAWARLGELEFSFGETGPATRAVEKSLELAPRNAQAVALKGFLLAARGRISAARLEFDRAIALDGALGNAWVGRGLCRIRRGDAAGGRDDLQVAATLEPQRALFRSYLGKAFSQVGNNKQARNELELAKNLDPNDPTAWLYAALVDQQANRINEAVRELERSEQLNDNRALYRSKLLLDQDQAVRGANLASVYSDAGLNEVSLREASRAVNLDYANYSAHLFLANSYAILNDPAVANLRYETPQVNEYLLANLLAPVGAGILSPAVSQQEYSRLFEQDRLGVYSTTEYSSLGSWRLEGAQY